MLRIMWCDLLCDVCSWASQMHAHAHTFSDLHHATHTQHTFKIHISHFYTHFQIHSTCCVIHVLGHFTCMPPSHTHTRTHPALPILEHVSTHPSFNSFETCKYYYTSPPKLHIHSCTLLLTHLTPKQDVPCHFLLNHTVIVGCILQVHTFFLRALYRCSLCSVR